MDERLREQIEYYRARAHEYDEWFYCVGRYDQGEAGNQQWFEEVAMVNTALHTLPRVNQALELACGTGNWTRELLQCAERITAYDAAPEMIAINRDKVQSERVTYQQLDLFDWQPQPEMYDLVFFGFWLSHVPLDQIPAFLQKVHTTLKPGGQVFMVDTLRTQALSGHNVPLPDDDHIVTRQLKDGRTFNIVKIYHDPEVLRQYFADANLHTVVNTTPNYFIYAHGYRASQP